MILGIGIDMCGVDRMDRLLADGADGFAASVFLPAEIAYCAGMHRPAEHFAARFAAKEAVIKALAAPGDAGAFWREIEIVREADGRPRVVLHGRLRALADRRDVGQVHVSLTHTATTAAAVAVAESAAPSRSEKRTDDA